MLRNAIDVLYPPGHPSVSNLCRDPPPPVVSVGLEGGHTRMFEKWKGLALVVFRELGEVKGTDTTIR